METTVSSELQKINIKKMSSTEDYSDVYLTPEETEIALNQFRMLKKRQMDERDAAKARRDERHRIKTQWTYDELKADVLNRTEKLPFQFLIDKDNELVFHQLCLYFSNDKRFEDYSTEGNNGERIYFKLNKGIMLMSEMKGTGKSILMQLFARNKRLPFLCIPTLTVANEYRKKGDDVIDLYSKHLHIGETRSMFFYTDIGICFEDLGHEPDKNNYGNKANVMYEVIFQLYENFRGKKDWSTFHVTSNCTGNDFANRYDDRIRSRMREMFNFIELPGKDRRK